MNYTLEEIKNEGKIETIIPSDNGVTMLGEFTIRINGVSIFADKVFARHGSRVMFVYVYKKDLIVAMYQYDMNTKELI